MKKGVLIFALLLFPSFAIGQRGSAPDGFLGFKWGSTIEDYAKLQTPSPEILNSNPYAKLADRYTNLFEGKGIRIGRRNLGKIGEVEVWNTDYFFKNEKFCAATVHYRDAKNFRVLREALTLRYGPPKECIGFQCKWELEIVLIHLGYTESKGQGTMEYVYVPVIDQEMRQEKLDAEKTKDSL